jgi:hypothetical protein
MALIQFRYIMVGSSFRTGRREKRFFVQTELTLRIIPLLAFFPFAGAFGWWWTRRDTLSGSRRFLYLLTDGWEGRVTKRLSFFLSDRFFGPRKQFGSEVSHLWVRLSLRSLRKSPLESLLRKRPENGTFARGRW